ncbi:MAG TPA: rhodanese-like domain-containing protein [Saprospiraceae bacterium]|nr:rhodanese-like domain-containing protein [Saprospiraceae bacterium]
MPNIDVKELKERLDRGEKFVFIDVREPYEYQEFNLGAQLIPLGEFPNAIPDLEKYKDEEIVIHCKMGGRSGVAQELLTRAGFKNVRNLEGGVLAWIQSFGI